MEDNNGITGGLQTTLPIAMMLSAFAAIAWTSAIDVNVVIWMTFKRRNGLYFYSLLGTSWGTVIYTLAFLMKFFQVWKNYYVSVTFINIGWYAMVTGQSLVLYSRLHLVVLDARKIKWVLYMIITNVFLFHLPTTVLVFGANSPRAEIFTNPYSIFEKVQVTAFSIQEFIISGLYVYSTKKLLKPAETFQKKQGRQIMLHLIYVNILVILMDISLICTEYANLYEIQTTLKGAVYSIKLKLEFVVLNQLISLVRPTDGSDQNQISFYNPSAPTEISLRNINHRSRRGRFPSVHKVNRNCEMERTDIDMEMGELTEQYVGAMGHGSQGRAERTVKDLGRGGLNQSETPSSPALSEVEFAAAGY